VLFPTTAESFACRKTSPLSVGISSRATDGAAVLSRPEKVTETFSFFAFTDWNHEPYETRVRNDRTAVGLIETPSATNFLGLQQPDEMSSNSCPDVYEIRPLKDAERL